jgi:hypothetical protein
MDAARTLLGRRLQDRAMSDPELLAFSVGDAGISFRGVA